jgi:hypothetical protein
MEQFDEADAYYALTKEIDHCDAQEIGCDACICRKCLMYQIEKLRNQLRGMHYPLPECTGPVYCACSDKESK